MSFASGNFNGGFGNPSGGFNTASNPSGGFQPSGGPSGGFQPSGGFNTASNPSGGFQPSGGPSGGFQPSGGPSGGFQPSGGFNTASNPSGGFQPSGGPSGGFQPSGGFNTASNPSGGFQPSGGFNTASNPSSGFGNTGQFTGFGNVAAAGNGFGSGFNITPVEPKKPLHERLSEEFQAIYGSLINESAENIAELLKKESGLEISDDLIVKAIRNAHVSLTSNTTGGGITKAKGKSDTPLTKKDIDRLLACLKPGFNDKWSANKCQHYTKGKNIENSFIFNCTADAYPYCNKHIGKEGKTRDKFLEEFNAAGRNKYTMYKNIITERIKWAAAHLDITPPLVDQVILPPFMTEDYRIPLPHIDPSFSVKRISTGNYSGAIICIDTRNIIRVIGRAVSVQSELIPLDEGTCNEVSAHIQRWYDGVNSVNSHVDDQYSRSSLAKSLGNMTPTSMSNSLGQPSAAASFSFSAPLSQGGFGSGISTSSPFSSQGGFQPSGGQQGGFQPSGGQQGGFQPSGGQQGGFQPSGGQQGGFQPSGGQQGGFQPSGGQQGGFQPSGGQQGGFQPSGGQQGGFQPSGGQQGGFQPSSAQGGFQPSAGSQGGFQPSSAQGGFQPAQAPSGAQGGFSPKTGGFQPSGSAQGGFQPSSAQGGFQPTSGAQGGFQPSSAQGGFQPTSGAQGGFQPSSAQGGFQQEEGRGDQGGFQPTQAPETEPLLGSPLSSGHEFTVTGNEPLPEGISEAINNIQTATADVPTNNSIDAPIVSPSYEAN